MLSINKKEQTIVICNNMDEIQNNHAEWKKPARAKKKKVYKVWGMIPFI